MKNLKNRLRNWDNDFQDSLFSKDFVSTRKMRPIQVSIEHITKKRSQIVGKTNNQ